MSHAAVGAIAALAIGGAAAAGLIIESRSSKTAAGQPVPSTLVLQRVSMPASAPIGQRLTATLTFAAKGGATQAQSVSVGVVITQGAAQSDTSAIARVPAIAAGQTAKVQITTAAPLAGFANGQARAVFALANGSTISFTFQVQAQPAAFQFVAGSAQATNSPVPVGQYATATVQVKNTGGTSGTPTVTGVSQLNGITEGNWKQTNKPIILPGQVGIVELQSDSSIVAQFSGDTLTGTLAFA